MPPPRSSHSPISRIAAANFSFRDCRSSMIRSTSISELTDSYLDSILVHLDDGTHTGNSEILMYQCVCDYLSNGSLRIFRGHLILLPLEFFLLRKGDPGCRYQARVGRAGHIP